MFRKPFVPWLLALAFLVALLWPSAPVEPQQVDHVLVTNFPDPQNVAGEVAITNPIRLAELVSFEEVLVPPVEPTETTRMVEAGPLYTDGFPGVVLSLQGLVKGEVKRAGTVGAILVPDQTAIQEPFDEMGLVLFPLEVAATGVSVQTPYFASSQPRYTVGFQAYRVLLYNTTDKTVTVNLFAYLTI